MVSWTRWAALTWSAVARCVAPLKLDGHAGSSVARWSAAPSVNVSFYWPEAHQDGHCDPEHYWESFFRGAHDHPWRVENEDDATMSLKCMTFDEAAYLALPRRRPGQFYVFWAITAPPYKRWSEAIVSREDFIFTHYDRREGVGDRANPMPGVTMPPPIRTFKEYDPAVPPEYFLTFRGMMRPGKKSKLNTRSELATDFMGYAGERGQKVVFEIPVPGEDYYGRYTELLNTAYAMVPSGHSRWSYRLCEAVRSCAIPVILSPGITMPYEDLIDWRSFAVFADSIVTGNDTTRFFNFGSNESGGALMDAALLDPQKLLNLLPSDPAEIAQRRQMACDIGRAYLDPWHSRLEAFLQSAAVHQGLLDATSVRDARVPPVSTGELRFVPKKLRRGSDVHSASITRIEFMYDGKLVDMAQANVTDDQEDRGAINVRFGKATKLHYFRFYTSAGGEEFDPVQWELLSVARSGILKQEWWFHQTANDTSTPTARNSPTQWFRLAHGARLR